MKKYLLLVLSALLIMGALAGCAEQTNTPERHMVSNTNAPASASEKKDILDDFYSKEDYQMLLALQFDDYQHMTISEFQNKVWAMTDTTEYMELMERFLKNETLCQMKDSDETAAFLFYVLEPLTVCLKNIEYFLYQN